MGEPRNVTRRALLGGMAAAGAATLIRAPAGLAAAAGQARDPVFSSAVGRFSGVSRQIRAQRTFALAGIEWTAPAGARIELRARARDGTWSPWVLVSALGHDTDRGTRSSSLFGEPVWTGPAEGVQLRSDRPVAGVRVHFVGAEPAPPARLAQALAPAQPVLAAGPGQPPIISRRAWAEGQAPPAHPPEYGTVKLAFVHHTVNPNGYGPGSVPSMLRGIFDYHRFVRGWWDIGYNFVIDAFGRTWEARAGGIDMAVVGAQAGGYNLESTGVAVLGDFTSVVPSPAAIDALRHLLAWKLSLHGLPARGRTTVVVDPASAFYTPFGPGAHVSLPRIAGHRDGDSTDCPGNALYRRLQAVRRGVGALAGMPARLTVTPQPTPATAGAPVTLSGALRTLAGAPLADAPIEIQQLGAPVNGTRAQTIATVTTASDGSWSIPETFTANLALRALHRPAPAAVADWFALIVAPALTVTVQSTTPLVVSGTVSPPKGHVIVDLYPAGTTSGKPLSKQRVPSSEGSFTAAVTPPGPGDYVLVARTKADAVNGAGASPPVPVTVT